MRLKAELAGNPALQQGAGEGSLASRGRFKGAEACCIFRSLDMAGLTMSPSKSSGTQNKFAGGCWKAKVDFCRMVKETRSLEGSCFA